MKKNLKHLLILLFLVIVLVLPYFVFAQESAPLNKLKEVGPAGGYSNNTTEYSLAETVGIIVSAFLSLLGIIFVVLMLYGGYNWMTAAGDESKVDKAKTTIRQAIIGLIIVAGSYAIWFFIYDKLFFSQ